MKWQPIETAPDTDTDVLVYCADTQQQFVGFRKSAGLYQYAYFRPGRVEISCRPTHWQPLPAAPDESRADTPTASRGAAISAPDGAQGE